MNDLICRAVQRNLSAYLDRELPAAEQRQVSAHLGQCSRCREAYQEMTAVDLSLGTAVDPPPPPDLTQLVLSRMPVPALRNQAVLKALRRTPEVMPAIAMLHASLAAGLLLMLAVVGLGWGRSAVTDWLALRTALLLQSGQGLIWRLWIGLTAPARWTLELARSAAQSREWLLNTGARIADSSAYIADWTYSHRLGVVLVGLILILVVGACVALWGRQIRSFAEE